MVANAAFLAMLLMLLGAVSVVGELAYLAPYKHFILAQYFWTALGALLLVFFNLFSAIYWIARLVWLKDTGRKLAFIERQLETPDTVARELSERLSTQP
jgi:hypothetical protein